MRVNRRVFLSTTINALGSARLLRSSVALADEPGARAPIKVGSEKQLFFDERFIAKSSHGLSGFKTGPRLRGRSIVIATFF